MEINCLIKIISRKKFRIRRKVSLLLANFDKVHTVFLETHANDWLSYYNGRN